MAKRTITEKAEQAARVAMIEARGALHATVVEGCSREVVAAQEAYLAACVARLARIEARLEA